MKTKILAASIMVLLGSGATVAQTYQIEAGAAVTHTDPDGEKSDDSLGLNGTYHFNRVQTANLPLAEAGFLQRSSNVYARSFQELDVINAGIEFYVPDTMFYVAGELQRVDIQGYRNNDWGVRLGVTPVAGLLVWTSYFDEPGYDVNIHAKYVMDLGYNNSLNIEGGYTDYDSHNAPYVFGDFYFNRTFSVGAGYSDEYENDAFTLRSRKFFTDSISGELAYTKADDDKSFTVGARMRF